MPPSGLVQHRLDQLEAANRIGQELHFQQAFGIFFGAIGVGDDAGADAHFSRAHGDR